jgi:hypothetical protein
MAEWEIDPRLIEILREAGNEWGPLDVALAAAELTDVDVLVAKLEVKHSGVVRGQGSIVDLLSVGMQVWWKDQWRVITGITPIYGDEARIYFMDGTISEKISLNHPVRIRRKHQ